MNTLNILFTSAGRRVSLIKHFKNTLDQLGIRGRIITTDIKRNAPAAFISDVHELVPRVNDLNYISTLKELCIKYEIGLLIPLIDTELNILASNKKEFEESGVEVLISSPAVNEICFDKRNTYSFFRDIGVDTPEILNPDVILGESNSNYPFLIKPSNGSCSVGVTKINNERELRFFKDYIPNAILQEFITGEEYTLDVLVDFEGNVRSIVPRLRLETRAGEVSKGLTVKNYDIINATKKVVEALPGALGCITVQCFLTANKEIKFLEINPRFGGGFPLSLAAGADFPLWIIKMLLNEEINIALDEWKEDVAMLRFDDAIFTTKDMIV